MNNLPLIRDNLGYLTTPCCDRPAGEKLLHKVPRVPLTRRVTNPESEDILQDEASFAVLDEITNNFIYDDLKV